MTRKGTLSNSGSQRLMMRLALQAPDHSQGALGVGGLSGYRGGR